MNGFTLESLMVGGGVYRVGGDTLAGKVEAIALEGSITTVTFADRATQFVNQPVTARYVKVTSDDSSSQGRIQGVQQGGTPPVEKAQEKAVGNKATRRRRNQ